MKAVQDVLDLVVHLPLNVTEPETAPLKEQYHVRYSFPLFVLCDQKGSVITRWEGYMGADRFISKLRQSLADLTTIKERVDRFEENPTYRDAIILAQYSSSIGQYLDARDYYKKASTLSQKDFSYEVFSNVVQAASLAQLPFDDALDAADSVLAKPSLKPRQAIRTIQTLTGVARSLDKTDYLGKYLESGIKISSKHFDAGFKKPYELMVADKILYMEKDTLGAIAYKKKTLPNGWESKPPEYYAFALWCLDRKINLGEAEQFVRRAVQKINPGSSRSTVLVTLAKICRAEGKNDESLKILHLAIEEDDSNEIAKTLQEEWTSSPTH